MSNHKFRRRYYWHNANAPLHSVVREKHGIVQLEYRDVDGDPRSVRITMPMYRSIVEAGACYFFTHIVERKRTQPKRTFVQRIRIAWRVLTNK